ncbi:MAG: CusA/CzcA family heavy metal efflux RND transporter [Bacteroidales bacterium]|nr:CusA/CzcA family heavy metal efflux RND transporter [Bacteroidales bacterium]
MFNRIIDFSVGNKLFVGITIIFLIAGGIYSMMNVPVDAVPDITNNQVQVVTVSPSLSPQEVEKLITYPVEMAMANILNVVEIRSVSRFGLSVVTIVFKDHVPILDARQLVNEQIQVVASELPAGLGTPQLMPITTGLGEIYQYTLEVDPKYRDKYSATDLRTIQDWIVKRQLSGIPGIVEISSFGGYLKQYEVAVDPDKMRAVNVTISEVFDALEKNNQNSGGSYIEKYNNAYYIRTEGMVKDFSDIEQIVVKNNNGFPILIRDVGKVHEGHAPRFGAMTKNGMGEAVGGITLMLKGANSSQVIREVKKRVAEVQERLPEGVRLQYYLDRSRLVKKTISTVTRNLMEGGLIVIFVLVLLLGDVRAGIIVASVIPLALLFAFIMMRLFGVSANLMSLGAIDFGIVVDGAVIIVEGVIHHLKTHHKGQVLSTEELGEIVSDSTKSIYKSAVFGVIIILIVFFPILSLTGIEGKTFRPMAQTVSFAIAGALFLGLTYVPMISSLFLSRKVAEKRTLSDRLIDFLKLTYRPVLRLSLRFKYWVLLLAFLVFGVSVWGFLHMGGEFIPTLEEGDLAMQMSLPPGSSLDESIEIATRAEQVLKKNFPEVLQVVSKIGTAEVPTDPMAVEDADIMITLKEKEEWVSASSREELVDKMKQALSVVTGATFEFTQPIQLRFNELMTGAKSDIAIKIFGEDMDTLYSLAGKAAAGIENVPGAKDVKVEKIQGLPQLVIRYDRAKLAKYGLTISELNHTVRSAFAGGVAGTVYEGEKKFDLVVRLEETYRRKADLNNLFVRTSQGQMIPLSEVATMEFYEGPMQISRDGTRRRVVIGVNVRGRDVESVVKDIEQVLGQNLKLPPGYYISYGGQFENLSHAKQRLSVAIPVALALIMLLLFFTFNSVKYALMIFTAVPLSAIGGIAALAIRGMPFSISAGVGFIALFGVAVLNGIVLISYYNTLKKEGGRELHDLVEYGAMLRLRPVMMTALVASLGFLPMAISTSAGAEVQKPLATVVIGGLITSTLLTMIVLPILYIIFNSEWRILGLRIRFNAFLPLLALFFLGQGKAEAQTRLTLEEAVQMALQNNPEIRNASLRTEAVLAKKRAVFDPGLTEIRYQKGQINSALQDQYLEVNQQLGSLPEHIARISYVKHLASLSRSEEVLTEARVTVEVKSLWFEWMAALLRMRMMQDYMQTAGRLQQVASIRYSTGEITLLEKTAIESEYMRLQSEYKEWEENSRQAANRIRQVLFLTDSLVPADTLLEMISPPESFLLAEDSSGRSVLMWYENSLKAKSAEVAIEKARYFPSLFAGYFRQDIDQVHGFEGWQAGISFPLWFLPQSAKVKEMKINKEIARNEYEYQKFAVRNTVENLTGELNKLAARIAYYRNGALQQADIMIRTAGLQYEKQEIGYLEYLQLLHTAMTIRFGYLDALKNYNQTAAQLEYYTR